MKEGIKKRILIIIILLASVTIITVCMSLFQNETTDSVIIYLKQTFLGEQTSAMSISGKVVTKNLQGMHSATIKLYKVNSKTEQLISTQNTRNRWFI